MSGSYDRPASRTVVRGGGNAAPAPAPAFTSSPSTQAAYGGGTHTGTEPPSVRASEFPAARNLPVQTRVVRRDREPTNAPIVPASSVTGQSLTLVISIMCCLACLTAGAVYMMYQSAHAWLKDVASEVTVQVTPQEGNNPDALVKEVAELLEQKKEIGIRSIRILTPEETAALLEPWLGNHAEALNALPVPRLIALEIDREKLTDFEGLRRTLENGFKGVTLDDHRRWQQQIRAVTNSFALGGIAILTLVAAATTAIIVAATRSAMLSNREIVEVLHFVGATDRFIAREFERHFLRLGIRAGLVGAATAMLVFLLMPAIMYVLGGGEVSILELRRLVGVGTLDAAGYVLLGVVVVVIAALCMLTSRFGVFRILNSRQ